jgi:predicted AAA+ superfamily ATPase
LDAAGVIRLIYPTTDYQAPAIYDLKKAPRLQFLDTGIVNNALGIQGELIQLSDFTNAYRGALIPHIITQEIISLHTDTDEKPLFWVRDKAQSSAEIDLVYRHNSILIPIEIKSGTTGSMKSLHQFINRVDHQWAIRMYGGKLSVETHKTPEGKTFQLLNLPYYLGTRIHDYIAYFVK